LAVELRRRAHELICQPARTKDCELHVLERVPTRLKGDHALRADPCSEPAADRLRVLKSFRLELRPVGRPLRRGDRLRDAPVLLDLRVVPAERDQEDEAEENDWERDAENANR